MNYKDWIIMIYDRYKKKYNEEYLNNNKKSTRKFKDLNIKEKLKLIFYFISVISGGIVYFIGIIFNIPIIFLIGVLLMIIPPIIIIYTIKFKFEDYKRRVRVLREVLKEENINTVPVIKILIKDTSGVLYKIKDGEANNYIKLVSFVGGAFGLVFGAAFGASNYLEKLKGENNNMATMFKIVILMMIIGGMIYIIRRMIPGNKYEKQKELHETLKILLIYEEGNKKDKLIIL